MPQKTMKETKTKRERPAIAIANLVNARGLYSVLRRLQKGLRMKPTRGLAGSLVIEWTHGYWRLPELGALGLR